MSVLPRTAARRDVLGVAREVTGALVRHRLATHASAVAFRLLVSLVPIALLGVGLLGALGLERVWHETISETLHRHLAGSVAAALDDTAERIFRRNGAGLLALAAALVVWNTLRAIRAVEHALDEIHEQEGKRPLVSGFLTGLALAVAVDLLVVATLAAVVLPPRLVGHGAGHTVLEIARWPAAVALLWLTVTALLRYAPAERPELGWASAGSAVVVGGWLGASVLFGAWSAYVADYRNAIGTLTAFLVLTAYVLALTSILVLGAQLDETLRRRNHVGRG